MTEKEIEFDTKVEYARYKRSQHDKIIYENGEFKLKRTFKVRGYDSLLHAWTLEPIKVYSEILPLSELKEKPSKSIETLIVLLREATDYVSLKLLKAFYKQSIRVSVKDLESNIYLTFADGHIFMVDLIKGVCAPLQFNSIPNNIKFERLSEAERITEQEKNELLAKGFPLYEELEMPNGKTELRILT